MNPTKLNIAIAQTAQRNTPDIAPTMSPTMSPVMSPVMSPISSPVISLAPENPRSGELLATSRHSIPVLSSHTAIELSPQTPRLHNVEILDSKNSSAASASSKTTFNANPEEAFFPLIASFCGDQFQSLNRIWISSRDNKSIDNRIPKSMLMAMVSLNAMVLSTLPMGMRDLGICKAALKQNGMAWPHIPRKFREEAHTSLGADLAMLAVTSNGLALGKIKPQLHTPALWDAAVANNAMAIACVPENKRTEEMYQFALAQVMGNSQLIAFLQPHMRTAEMYELAVKEGNCPLQYIPPEMLSKTMFMNLIIKHGMPLRFIPEEFIDKRVCLEAVKDNKNSIRDLPQKIKDDSVFWRAAIAIGSIDLSDVPDALRADGEIDRQALSVNGKNLRYIDPQKRTPEMCDLAVSQNGLALADVPEVYKTHALVKKALAQNGLALQSLKNSARFTLDNIELALSSNPLVLKILHPNERNLKRCIDAVRRNPEAIKFVPAIHVLNNTELQEAALTQYQDNLPSQQEMSLLATKTNSEKLLQSQTHAATQSSSSSSSSSSASSVTDINHQEKQIIEKPWLPLLMMEHIIELNPGWKQQIIRNPLCQGIPINFLLEAQICHDFLMDLSFKKYETTELKMHSEQLGIFSSKAALQAHLDKENLNRRMYDSIFITAIMRNPANLEKLSPSARTPELCMLAVRKNGNTIALVPPPLRTEALCLIAFANVGSAVLPYLPPDLAEQLS